VADAREATVLFRPEISEPKQTLRPEIRYAMAYLVPISGSRANLLQKR